MVWQIIAGLLELPDLFRRNDDDFFDRLNHRWTAFQLVGFAILTTVTLLVGEPIYCWTPNFFSDSWGNYTNSYCWVKNTYYVPFEEEIPKDISKRKQAEIMYYQWVPIILMAQALLFYLPIVMWRTINDRTGMDINDCIESALKMYNTTDTQTKDKMSSHLTQQTLRYLNYLDTKRNSHRNSTHGFKKFLAKFCNLFSMQCGCFVTIFHIFLKLTFLANIVGQFWMLNLLLGQNFLTYGFHFLDSVVDGEEWVLSERFPRVTMCDLVVRVLGNNHRYTVQCVLTINFFNEKIFLYIWFWLAFIFIMTSVGLILSLLRILTPGEGRRYVTNHILCHDPENLSAFVNGYLRTDGVHLLRLVAHNTNKDTLSELLGNLWKNYQNVQKQNGKKGTGSGLLDDDS